MEGVSAMGPSFELAFPVPSSTGSLVPGETVIGVLKSIRLGNTAQETSS